jgi:pimeloyl-ACP methyl ester carboxylesterase
MSAPRQFTDRWTEVALGSQHVRVHSLYSAADPGPGPPVIFVPGLGTSSPTLVPTARLLPNTFALHLVDLPGFGRSENPPTPLDLEGYAAVVRAWIHAVGLERVCVVGHSFGAQVAVELALDDRAFVERLGLVSLTVDPSARSFPAQLARLALDATREPWPLLRLLARDYQKAGIARLLQIGRIALADRIEKTLPAIEVPTLLVRGDRDPLVPARWADEMSRLVRRAELVVIAGATHAVPYTAPKELALALQDFLAHP